MLSGQKIVLGGEMEKISFLYLSPIVAGKIASPIVHLPEPWITVKEVPCSASFDVTFGLIIKLLKPYRVEIDVYYEGESMIEKDRGVISADPIVARATSKNDYVSIENMQLRNVTLKNLGLHRLQATLYGDADGSMKEVHMAESFFYVSDGWGN